MAKPVILHFTTREGTTVDILASQVVSIRRMRDDSFVPRTGVDSVNSACYMIIQSEEEYEALRDQWRASL